MEAPQESKKDPLREGRPEWADQVQRLAHDWAGQHGVMVSGIDVARLMEYQLLDSLNRIYDGQERE